MKFLNEVLIAIGILLIGFGLVVPVDRYQQAKVSFIEAKSLAEQAAMFHREFAPEVERALSSLRACVVEREGCTAEALADDRANGREFRELGLTVGLKLQESKKQIELAAHYKRMSNIWIALGFISFALGFISVFVGGSAILKRKSQLTG